MGHKKCVHIQNREGFIKEGCESSKNHSGVPEGVQIDRALIKEGCSDREVLLYILISDVNLQKPVSSHL